MAKSNVIDFLTKKPARDEAAEAAFYERFFKNIGPAFREVAEDVVAGNHTEYLLKGGRGSLKSSFVGMDIIKILRENPRGNALILRKVAATMRDTVYSQMLWALDILGVYDEWECTVSPMKMVNKRTGQEIMFRGLDDPRKIKSIKPRRGYFAVVWFEEAEEYDNYAEIRNVMQSAGRGKNARAITFLTYNPPKSANNWINKEAMEPRSGRLVHHSSYLQAPPEWLGERFLREAEELRANNERAWQHEYAGEATGTGGAVFSNLEIRAIPPEERAPMMDKLRHGLDFGYALDPSALVQCHYREGDKTLFILAEYYKAGAGFDKLEQAIKTMTRGQGQVWSDTEPRTVAELYGRGIKIAAARKGRGSRSFGMMWLEGLHKIVIDPATCPNAAREYSAYEYERDPRTGEFRADYPDGDDHTIDATRYGLWTEIHKNKRKNYYSGKGARR